jgi:hypothetical protein
MLCGLCLATAVGGSRALAQAKPAVFTEPDWKRKPSADQLIAVWPHEALKQHKLGQAVIHCRVNVAGGLYNCKVVSETPPGLGFGDAALALTPQFLMNPATRDGQPIDYDGVTIPLNWKGDVSNIPTDVMRTDLVIRAWASAPTYAEVAATYPDKAKLQTASGHVVFNCAIKTFGRLSGCQIATEEPRGVGFGSAAYKLLDKFVGPSVLPDGRKTLNMTTQLAVSFPAEMAVGGAPLIGRPHWVTLPTGDQLRDAFPKAPPGGAAVSAKVVLDCAIVAGGHVDDCKVESETPAGQGYGAAVMGISHYFTMSIWTEEGLPTVGGRVKIPLRYEIAAAEPAAPAPSAPPAKP